MRSIGTAATDIPNGSNFPSGFHTLIGMNMANRTVNAITIDAYLVVNNSDNDPSNENKFYIVKDMTIPTGSAFSHDSKIVLLAGDRLFFESSAANSLDVIVSYVENISA